MELIATIDQNEYQLKVEQLGDHRFRVNINGVDHEVDCMEVMEDLYSMIHHERSYDVHVHHGKKGHIETHFYDDSFHVEVVDPMQKILDQAMGGGGKGPAALEAAMPGLVQRILVKEGDEVAMDQGLLVLVAMKMENELGSPKAGVVKEIRVKEGDNVESGAVLITIE
ncbi:biotin/lipoyl-containing protein [Acanthopleuribacter pedis]|uniref:Lipoyl-binding domain-containing protein n=1 Tax=Acanthopleuribacter pedis TaxID=442870 RepID=A0A8J7Q5U8_9BACT|nr:biotin/lipoyl-containing protein [Acanthopleuribacter pedis]MBO1317194.1 hypothetical protein [Acanthopleuribacter pedis]